MTLLYFDGFDGYGTTSNVEDNSGFTSGDTTVSSIITTSLKAGVSGQAVSLGNDARLSYSFGSDVIANTHVVGLAFKYTAQTDPVMLIACGHEAYAFTEDHLNCYVSVSVTGKLQLRRAGTLLATGTANIVIDTWYFIEGKFLIADSGGSVEIKLNGAVDVSYSGDTRSPSIGVTTVLLGGTTWSGANTKVVEVDDVYILNTIGSKHNDYLGEIRSTVYMPDGQDSTNNYTRVGGGTNDYEAIDEAGAPDDDTTYIHSATTTTKDVFTVPNLPATPDTVHAVKLNTRAAKDDAGTRGATAGIDVSAVLQTGAEMGIGTSYTNFIDIFPDKDNSAGAWDETAFNAMKVSIEVTS